MQSSPRSDTRVVEAVTGSNLLDPSKDVAGAAKSTRNLELETQSLTAACMATAVELEKTRVLVSAIESENRLLTERLETEKRMTSIITELNETRKSESEALRSVVVAKNETIAAKDIVITSQDKLVESLKKKKPSPWRRFTDILIGAAAFAILK